MHGGIRSVRKYLFGNSPLGPSRKVKAAIRKATGKINSGTDEARERFERMLFSQCGVREESVLLGSSLKELVYIVFRALKPASVLIIGPAVDDYREAALSTGAAVETFCSRGEGQFLPDLESLKAEAGKCDLLVLANPNRITGRALADGMLSELLDIVNPGFAAASSFPASAGKKAGQNDGRQSDSGARPRFSAVRRSRL